MAAGRRALAFAGRLAGLVLLLAIAAWVAWTWPWAPLVWLGVPLVIIAALGAARMLARH